LHATALQRQYLSKLQTITALALLPLLDCCFPLEKIQQLPEFSGILQLILKDSSKREKFQHSGNSFLPAWGKIYAFTIPA
jgi:hypothetical protein